MLLVDAANVVGARPDHWWRDRPAAARRLLDDLRAALDDRRLEPPVVVVLEGQARRAAPEGEDRGLQVVHAAASGDDTLVALAEAASEPFVVVTADRELRDRAARPGATLRGPRWLLGRLEGRPEQGTTC